MTQMVDGGQKRCPRGMYAVFLSEIVGYLLDFLA